MRIFQDMSEVPMEENSHEELPECRPNATAYVDPLENPAKLSLLTRPNNGSPTQNSSSAQILCPISDSYVALQSPVPLLYSWSSDGLLESLNDDSKEDTQEHNEIAKTKKANRSKCIRKFDVDKKKAIKKMRNRVSAQKSRDRKKKELEDLMDETEKVGSENECLKSKLGVANSELELLHRVVESLPSQGKDQFNKLKADLSSHPHQSKKKCMGAKKPSKRSHAILATLLIGCVYFASCVNPMTNTFKGLSHESLINKADIGALNTANCKVAEKNTLTSLQ